MKPSVRLAFFTIGESPRVDVMPDMRRILGEHVQIDEFGALDGLTPEARAALAPRAGAYRFATRLADGSAIELDRDLTEVRLAEVMRKADGAGYDALVPLCTGTALPPMNTLMIEPQQVVDHALVGLTRHCRKLGIVVPLAAQVEHFHLLAPLPCDTALVHASPYDDADTARRRLVEAGQQLRDCDLIVMHCMGYQGWMRDVLSQAAGAPTLLANRLVAACLSQMFEPANEPG